MSNSYTTGSVLQMRGTCTTIHNELTKYTSIILDVAISLAKFPYRQIDKESSRCWSDAITVHVNKIQIWKAVCVLPIANVGSSVSKH